MQAISRSELAEIIGRKTLSMPKDKLVASVAAYLAAEHRSANLDDLLRDVMQYRLEQGIVEATVISAHETTPGVMNDVRQLLKEHFPSAKQIVLNSQINPELVGGVRIELPGETLDLSVRAKLNRFKRLTEGDN